MSKSQTDKLLWLHGTPDTPALIGTTGSAYTATEVYFGYASPQSNIGAGGAHMGLHVYVGTAFDSLTSAQISIVHGASTAPTTVLSSRTLTLAQLSAGSHYFIPMAPQNLAYVRGYFAVTSSSPTAGTVFMSLGPGEDGGV